MSSRILPLVAAVALALTATPSHAQKAAKLTWGPAPPFLPAGAQFALVSGDPAKAGPFEIELSMPNGYTVPPHSHPTAEIVTVKSGHFHYGMGDKIDHKTMKNLDAGQNVNLPANMHHYAQVKGHTVISINSNGPFAITYVNPADDPRTKAKTK